MAHLGVPYRDLVVLDPYLPLPYPAAIFVRRRALVVNLEYIRMIITADYALLLNFDEERVARFVASLQRRLSALHRMDRAVEAARQAAEAAAAAAAEAAEAAAAAAEAEAAATAGSAAGAAAAEGIRRLTVSRSFDAARAARVAARSPSALDGDAPPPPDAWASALGDTGLQHGVDWQLVGDLPFELRVLEAVLGEVDARFSGEISALEAASAPVLEALTRRVCRPVLEAVRALKAKLFKTMTTVQTIVEVLERLVEDDDGMGDFYLSRKRDAEEAAALEEEDEARRLAGGGTPTGSDASSHVPPPPPVVGRASMRGPGGGAPPPPVMMPRPLSRGPTEPPRRAVPSDPAPPGFGSVIPDGGATPPPWGGIDSADAAEISALPSLLPLSGAAALAAAATVLAPTPGGTLRRVPSRSTRPPPHARGSSSRGTSSSSSSSSSSGTGSTAADEAIEGVEELLEAYFMQMNFCLKRLSTLKEAVEDSEDFVSLEIDSHRNQLFKLDLLINLGAFALGIFMAVTSLFGMNLVSGLEPVPFAFHWVTAGGVVATAGIFWGVILYLRTQKVMFVSNSTSPSFERLYAAAAQAQVTQALALAAHAPVLGLPQLPAATYGSASAPPVGWYGKASGHFPGSGSIGDGYTL